MTTTQHTPRLIGVGMGPGDPELVTIKALRTLEQADVIVVPETERRSDAVGRAEEMVLSIVPGAGTRIRRIPFSMATGLQNRLDARSEAARAMLAAFAEGAGVVAFASVGDPAVYSTFTYVATLVTAERDDVAVELIPGITAMQAIAAVSGLALTSGSETLQLVPATAGDDVIADALARPGTVVIYKGGRRIGDIVALVRAHRKEAVVATDLGLPEQRLYTGADVEALEKVSYFTTVLATDPR